MDPDPRKIQRNGHESPRHDPMSAQNLLNSETERDQNLGQQFSISSGGHMTVERRPSSHKFSKDKMSAVCRVKDELNEVVFCKLKMWMILILIFILIAIVILISLALCSLVYKDKDEEFNASSFNVSRLFNGSFRLQSRDENLTVSSSDQSQALSSTLQQRLKDLYTLSPALGRYFSSAEVDPLRKDPAVAEFRLKFLMPADQKDRLRKFTLSREMIYNVLRQSLFDQDPDTSVYIEPSSLRLV